VLGLVLERPQQIARPGDRIHDITFVFHSLFHLSKFGGAPAFRRTRPIIADSAMDCAMSALPSVSGYKIAAER
jgi:hypothetical protein